MKNILILLLYCLPALCFSQESNNIYTEKEQMQERLVFDWLSGLNDKGLDLTEDSLKIGKELQKMLDNKKYRTALYPEVYTWEETTALIKAQELKRAFWFFINLYQKNETNKELVIRSILSYDKIFQMDKLMVNSFYTYSFMDPEVSIVKDGKPEIVRPDILEAKLRNVKEIVGYIYSYRKQQEVANAK